MLRTDLTDDTVAAGVHPAQHNEANQAILDLQAGSGVDITRAFEFAFDTPGLLTGHAVYTPTIGDILKDAWIEIVTAWDGTTPQADIGTFVGSSGGLFDWSVPSSGAIDMALVAGEGAGAGLRLSTGLSLLELKILYNLQDAYSDGTTTNPNLLFLSFFANGGVPAKFTAADPIKVCVSQDGTNTGADPGSTHGTAILYLVTATPV